MKLCFLKPAKKALESYDKPTRLQISRAIAHLPNGDVAKMKGNKIPPLYRLRVGKYRVIYEVCGNEITITRIDSRGDVYK